MSHGTPANIKLDNSRSVSKQLTRQGEMSFFNSEYSQSSFNENSRQRTGSTSDLLTIQPRFTGNLYALTNEENVI